jgi:uncharacterized protein YdeI (YjbR/CyaY-like superfamily)
VKPRFFATPAAFRAWLDEHHATSDELLVGFYKTSSGTPSITWPESVDEALCFGWIDGVRRTIDAERYSIRFSRRTARSNWSLVNIRRARELIKLGRMRPAGLRAFERRDESAARYSYEQRHAAELEPADERAFRADQRAWAFFQSQPPSYRKAAIWWVMSAKQDATREKRLATLIDDSAHGIAIKPLRRSPTAPGTRPASR